MPTPHEVPVGDGETVVALHHEGDEPGWFVCCHGLLSDKTGSYAGRCERAVAAGYDAVRFDFRGCGESDRSFVDTTLSTRIADLRAVLEYFEPESVVLYGSSFGGTTALHTAVDEERVAAVVVRAPVTDAAALDAYRDALPSGESLELDDGRAIDERFFAALDAHPFSDVVDALSVPVAVFHGTDDESVPFDHSLQAVADLETDAMLQAYRGEGHRFSRVAEDRHRAQTFAWLSTVS